jgi:hypothetical protein
VDKRWIAGVLLLALLECARAQPRTTDSEEAAAAMRRAERLAANPMRVIQQAGKLRRREAPPPAETPESAAPAAVRTVVVPRLQASPLLTLPLPAALPALPGAASAVQLAMPNLPLQPVAARLQGAQAQQAQQPRLISTVDPDIPRRLRVEVGRVNDVLADLTLRADGSVASVALVSPAPRNWQTYLTAALMQWRFEPLATGRVHRVQLVFADP